MSNPPDAERLRRLSDEELIRLVAEHDPAALEVLYDRHHVLAFSLALRIVRSRDQAQDIVQEAFLNLWRDAGRHDPIRGPVRTWLMRIVHDRGIAAVRDLPVHERIQADATTRATQPSERNSPTGPADARDQAPPIRAALQALPEDQRRIIELAFFDGWTQHEIADMLKLPLDTVKRRARGGLTQLRDAMLSELQAPP